CVMILGTCKVPSDHFDTVRVTVYNANKYDKTASGFVIRNNENIVAVSPDLLDKYPYGSIIYLLHPEVNKKYGYVFTVLDRTNARITNTIDILSRDSVGLWNAKILKIDGNETKFFR